MTQLHESDSAEPLTREVSYCDSRQAALSIMQHDKVHPLLAVMLTSAVASIPMAAGVGGMGTIKGSIDEN
jgi:hypothetical protein